MCVCAHSGDGQFLLGLAESDEMKEYPHVSLTDRLALAWALKPLLDLSQVEALKQ